MTNVDVVRSAYDAWSRRDVERLVEMAHPDVEIAPLVVGITCAGPWSGRDAVRRLMADVERSWERFDVRCDDILAFGERFVALVHVEVAAREGAPVVTGDIAHLIEFEGDLVRHFAAYRQRAQAVAAARE